MGRTAGVSNLMQLHLKCPSGFSPRQWELVIGKGDGGYYSTLLENLTDGGAIALLSM